MKLKALPKRAHNIFFHTHTVTGIVTSAALFIIFYTGAFALFRHELLRWENPQARFEAPAAVDFSRVLSSIKAANPAFAEAEHFSLRLPNEMVPYVQFFGAEQSEDGSPRRFKALINTAADYQVTLSSGPATTVGETLYELHFFGQLPGGEYLSGFIAVFLLFAILTGVLIHWKNLLQKFYAFTVRGKWKQIWTNAHTVLGIIGLPFQVVYAVTGALFGLLTLLLVPSAFILFGGDTQAVLGAVRPESAIPLREDAPKIDHASLDKYYERVRKQLPGIPVSVITVRHHSRSDGIASFYFDDEMSIGGTGQLTFALNSGEVVSQNLPGESSYTKSVLNIITKLHFGTFGGLLLKGIYFILAMITCFMLLSGVLLWQQARNNKNYTDKQQRFHHRVTKANLAVCLSLFPATSLLFLANKLLPMELAERVFYVNAVFFIGWLLLTLLGLRWNDFRKLNLNYLRLGAIAALAIPIVNGLVTGDWLWKTFASGQYYVGSVDVFWLMAGLAAIGAKSAIQKTKSAPKAKNQPSEPIAA
jgi:uncharacterized iron-regulated membrane protein